MADYGVPPNPPDENRFTSRYQMCRQSVKNKKPHVRAHMGFFQVGLGVW